MILWTKTHQEYVVNRLLCYKRIRDTAYSKVGSVKEEKDRVSRQNMLKCEQLGRKNVRIMYWSCASMKQRQSALYKLLNGADIVVLQETNLGEGTVYMI
uniref:Endonuclease/exonuclease/phosphatase domain-containing protein n=1 Tax=Arion vulgaris TaxID=1028688 RepID=A0A0B7BMF5_9EUPU